MQRKTLIAALFALFALPGAVLAATRLPDLVIVDASDFLDRLAKGDTVRQHKPPELPWLFNNFGINLKAKEEISAPSHRSLDRHL